MYKPSTKISVRSNASAFKSPQPNPSTNAACSHSCKKNDGPPVITLQSAYGSILEVHSQHLG